MVQTRRTRKQRTDAAINFALERRWEEAAAENRALLEDFPDDMEAANRLGKALTELGDLDGAAEAYQRTLAMDSTNAIARRNLTRIEEMREQTAKPKRATGAAAKRGSKTASTAATPAPAATPAAMRAHSLIEESGKSAEFTLLDLDLAELKRIAAGDPAEIVASPRGVSVQSANGVVLGHIEPRAGLRLRRLMEGGNQYTVVIRRVADNEATVYIRETFRAAELKDQPSFLPPAQTAARRRAAPRAYTKPTSVLRYGGGGDTDEDGEDDGWAPRGPSNNDDDEMEESGFGDVNDGDEDDMDGMNEDDGDMAGDDEDDE